jgi:DNA (cytosine-5)-methyltransferase 1
VLTVGSLFAGIGGFDLGLERAGMRTVWFCEQDPYCQRVLARHWPGVPCHPDVRALVADTGRERDAVGREARDLAAARPRAQGPSWERERPRDATHDRGADRPDVAAGTGQLVPVPVPYVDVLAGGFPCQDLSYAGKGAGLDGARSGLWNEYARLIRELRPRYVIVENVSALLARGMERVLGDLAAIGYDAEWDCIPASAVGAPHRRDRVWIVAYPNGEGEHARPVDAEMGGASQPVAYPNGAGLEGHRGSDPRTGELAVAARRGQGGARIMGDTDRMAGTQTGARGRERGTMAQPREIERTLRPVSSIGDHWLVEPDVGRVAHGVPNRVDRLRSLGNALVPQIAEWLGRRIIEHEAVALPKAHCA